MPQSISQQLDEIFHQASLSHVHNLLKSKQDRAEFEAINQNADKTRKELNRLYLEEYDGRVDTMRARLLDNAAQSHFDHPPPPGGGNDRAGFIELEAHRRVRLAHEVDLQQVRIDTLQELDDLMHRAHRRGQLQGTAVDAFLRASDRRSGEDRRIPNQRLD